MPPHLDRADRLDITSQLWRLNNLYWITDKYGKKVKFRMTDQQYRYYVEMHFLNCILKSRQHGFTTLIDLYALDSCVFIENTRAGIIAHNKDDAKVIFRDKVKFPYDNLPDQIKEEVFAKTDRAGELLFSNNSAITVSTSFRSGTLQILHVSEYGKIAAKYPDKAREIKTGAFEAVAQGQQIHVESTAEGVEGEFKKLCDDAQNLQRQGKPLTELDFKFHFVPWFVEPSYRSDPTNVVITEEIKRYFRKLYFEHNIRLDRGQIAWYSQKAQRLGDDIKREHPSTPEEAFETSIEGAYFAGEMGKLRKEGRLTQVPHEPGLPVSTFWDLGMDDAMSIWFCQSHGAQKRLIDYEEHSGEGLPFYAALVLKEKPYNYDNHYFPHDIKYRELGTGKSRLEVAQSLGINPIIRVPRPVSQAEVQDGINNVRTFLNSCWIDEQKCARGVSCLDNYRKQWDENNAVYKLRPLHNWASHGADSMRTGAMGLISVKPREFDRSRVKTGSRRGRR